jgi:ABC-type polysaccharide/polyol phosphate export permease
MLWLVGVPLVNAVVLSIVFSRIVRIQTGTNYPTFVFSGVVPWTFFVTGMSSGATSITSGSGLASKVYFPRAVFPLVSVTSNLYGFAPGLAIIFGVALIFHVRLGAGVVLIVPAVALMILLTISFALVFAATNVYLRDTAFIVEAVALAWFYGSAVIFPLRLISNGILRAAITANPATGMIEMFRAATVGADPGWTTSVWWSIAWVAALLIVALLLYRRFDRVFADLL